ncbi:hypothetical protein RZS08_56220, partial [Arthrospira platensis SPKY1]|nr:hypothetical protein [Arthrospira platensis SPKY1]
NNLNHHLTVLPLNRLDQNTSNTTLHPMIKICNFRYYKNNCNYLGAKVERNKITVKDIKKR